MDQNEDQKVLNEYQTLLNEYEITSMEHCNTYYCFNLKLKTPSPLIAKIYSDLNILRKGCSNNSYWAQGSDLEPTIEPILIEAFNKLLKRPTQVLISHLLISKVYCWSDLDEAYTKTYIEFQHEGKTYTYTNIYRMDSDIGRNDCEEGSTFDFRI